MKTAAQFIAALDKWGVPWVGVPGWSARSRRGSFDPVGVMQHHTGSDIGEDRCDEYAAGILSQGRSDLPGPLCVGAPSPQGRLFLTGWGRTNHAGSGSSSVLARVRSGTAPTSGEMAPGADEVDGNAFYLGLEWMRSGARPAPPAQYACAVRTTAALCDLHGWSGRHTLGHREHTRRKIDPGGIDMGRFRADVAWALDHGPAQTAQRFPLEDDDMFTDADRKTLENAARFAGDAVNFLRYRLDDFLGPLILATVADALKAQPPGIDPDAAAAAVVAAIAKQLGESS